MTTSYRPKLVQTTAEKLLSKDADEPIADNSVGFVLTDPPYLISKKTGFTKKNSDGNFGGIQSYAINTEFGGWDEEGGFTIQMLEEAIAGMYRVLKPGGAAIIFFDGWKLTTLKKLMQKEKFEGIRIIEWRKTNAVPINSRTNYLTNGREFALYGYKPGAKPILNDTNPLGVYKDSIHSGKFWDRFHTTQKSLSLFEQLIKEHSNPGDVVVDPYSGSGTTAVAARNTGRAFIGSEPSDEYFEKSSRRISIYCGEQGEPDTLEDLDKKYQNNK